MIYYYFFKSETLMNIGDNDALVVERARTHIFALIAIGENIVLIFLNQCQN